MPIPAVDDKPGCPFKIQWQRPSDKYRKYVGRSNMQLTRPAYAKGINSYHDTQTAPRPSHQDCEITAVSTLRRFYSRGINAHTAMAYDITAGIRLVIFFIIDMAGRARSRWHSHYLFWGCALLGSGRFFHRRHRRHTGHRHCASGWEVCGSFSVRCFFLAVLWRRLRLTSCAPCSGHIV